MTVSVFAYNNSDADASSDEIKAVVGGLESTLSEMDGDVQKLSSAWEGREQEQYQRIYHRWSSAAENMRNILEQIQCSLDENTASVCEMRSHASRAISGK
ncbi:MAG: WXG100 family type VII secretion target [Corynebacterium sp.]|nr:WXG100 family type VII secretion target [Corynebacterium sp.]